jgi:hypothetical protein
LTTIYTVLLWAALAGGIVPSVWFLLWARPSWPPKSPAYVVSGLVLVILLLYVRVGVPLALRGGVPAYRGLVEAGFAIGLALVCDAWLIALLLKFRQYRAAWRAAANKNSEEEAPHGPF